MQAIKQKSNVSWLLFIPQPKAKFNACHFLQNSRFTNSFPSFVDMTYEGDSSILAKTQQGKKCYFVTTILSLHAEMTHII